MKPINLNKARKSRAKLQAKQKADSNAVQFGRTKAEKVRDAASAKATDAFLDGHKRER